ncbi:MAG: class I SAM-dependent methyltransferase [Bacillus sp. (in: Bacteria)]|nr:class I SAM-dependent methyltransferase [Bacillus sp. (in: firmicutes)]
MKDVIITTCGRPNQSVILKAEQLAERLRISYIKREKQSVHSLISNFNAAVIVVEKDRLTVQAGNGQPPFFFHPNAAMFRAKRFLKTKEDPLVQACQLQREDKFLDATLGLGSDAIIASMATGVEGEVTGIESSEIIAFIVEQGMQTYSSNVPMIDEALRRINVQCSSHLQWLQGKPADAYDVIYFDPMFEEAVTGAIGFDAMRSFTVKSSFTGELVEEAKRVAKKRVVLRIIFAAAVLLLLVFRCK